MHVFEFLQKNWLPIVLVIGLGFALASSGILGFQASATRRYLDEARDRVTELEETLSKADITVRSLQREFTDLRGDYRKLESNTAKLKDQYQALREYYNRIEVGNRDLTQSNERSIELTRAGLNIIREIRANN